MPSNGPIPNSSPLALTSAMLEGLEARRFFRPPTRTRGVTPRQNLKAISGLLGFPAPRTYGLPGRLLRRVRQIAKRIMGPWLELQTRFNHETIGHLERHTIRLDDFDSRLDELNSRLTACFAEMCWVQKPTDANPQGHGRSDPVAAIESLFLHTRLPRAPGRALVLSNPAAALDLASLGFATTLVHEAGSAARHPSLRCVAGAAAALPFEDHSFDLVVAFAVGHGNPWQDADTRRELARVLSAGGAAIGSAEAGTTSSGPALTPFDSAEITFAARAGQGWTLSREPTNDAGLILWVAHRA